MERITRAGAILAFLFLASCGQPTAHHNGDSVDSAQDLNSTKFDTSSSQMNTSELLLSLYSSGLYDATASRRVADKALDGQIRNAAAKLAGDQEKLNKEVVDLAARKQVSLPGGLSVSQQQKLNAMLSAGGSDIGGQYVRQMIYDHKDALVQLNQGIQSNDTDIVNWSTRATPKMQDLIDQATTMQTYLDSLPRGRSTAR